MTATSTTSTTTGSCDLAVVGAGIVGLAVARELLSRRPGLRLVVIDKEPQVGAHQTGHNSGVIHAGIYYQPGSLKARLCVEGAAALFDYCEQREIALDRCGKVIVALHERELGRLDELERRGRANGVPGLRRLDAAGLREVEPHAAGVAALHSPNTAIVDFPAPDGPTSATTCPGSAVNEMPCSTSSPPRSSSSATSSSEASDTRSAAG